MTGTPKIVSKASAIFGSSRPEDVRGYTSLVAQAKRWEPLWRKVARGEDHGYVAGTFHLYRLR